MYNRKFKNIKNFDVVKREDIAIALNEAIANECGIIRNGDKSVLVSVRYTSNNKKIHITFNQQGFTLMEDEKDDFSKYMLEREIIDFFDMEKIIYLKFKRVGGLYATTFPNKVILNGEQYIGMRAEKKVKNIYDFLSYDGLHKATFIKDNGEEVKSCLPSQILEKIADIIYWK